jgi:hypothetical protein
MKPAARGRNTTGPRASSLPAGQARGPDAQHRRRSERLLADGGSSRFPCGAPAPAAARRATATGRPGRRAELAGSPSAYGGRGPGPDSAPREALGRANEELGDDRTARPRTHGRSGYGKARVGARRVHTCHRSGAGRQEHVQGRRRAAERAAVTELTAPRAVRPPGTPERGRRTRDTAARSTGSAHGATTRHARRDGTAGTTGGTRAGIPSTARPGR